MKVAWHALFLFLFGRCHTGPRGGGNAAGWLASTWVGEPPGAAQSTLRSLGPSCRLPNGEAKGGCRRPRAALRRTQARRWLSRGSAWLLPIYWTKVGAFSGLGSKSPPPPPARSVHAALSRGLWKK